jgi:hypothetical protein
MDSEIHAGGWIQLEIHAGGWILRNPRRWIDSDPSTVVREWFNFVRRWSNVRGSVFGQYVLLDGQTMYSEGQILSYSSIGLR